MPADANLNIPTSAKLTVTIIDRAVIAWVGHPDTTATAYCFRHTPNVQQTEYMGNAFNYDALMRLVDKANATTEDPNHDRDRDPAAGNARQPDHQPVAGA